MYNPLTKRLNLKQLLLFWNDYESVPAILHQIHGQILVDILANSFSTYLFSESLVYLFHGPSDKILIISWNWFNIFATVVITEPTK